MFIFDRNIDKDEQLNPDQLKKARELEVQQLRMDDPHFHHTRAITEYDVLFEVRIDSFHRFITKISHKEVFIFAENADRPIIVCVKGPHN